MFRLLPALFLLAITSLSSLGCDGSASETEHGAIRGHAFGETEAGDAPLAGADVTAVSLSIEVPASAATVTSDDGSFELADLPPAWYSLTVSHEGYEDAFEIVMVREGAVSEETVTLRRAAGP